MRQINQWMLCREVMAVYGQNRAERINTPCGRNEEFLGLNLAVHRVITDLSRVNIFLYNTNVYLRNATVYTKAVSRLFW
jgi:hypothetical protein